MAYMLLDKAARKVFHAQGHRDPTQGLDTTADRDWNQQHELVLH
jgi:hypothetical protein